MGEPALRLVEDPEYADGDGCEPETIECDCGNRLFEVSADFTTCWCPLCGAAWMSE